MNAGAIILAGGNSTRMGTNKALLKINGMTNIERIVAILRPVFPQPILITNDTGAYTFLGVQTVSDHYPGKGPLAGIHAGLAASPFAVNVIVACDMPFVSAKVAAALVKKSPGYDAVVPVIAGRPQPLFAVYQKKLADAAEVLLQEGRLRIKDLLAGLNVLYLTEEELRLDEDCLERLFFNMNHPHEYEVAVHMAKEDKLERGSLLP